MIRLPRWPRKARDGQRADLPPARAAPTSAPGINIDSLANTSPAHPDTDRCAAVVPPSKRALHPATPHESANPHSPLYRARGFLHGRLSYASARNPSPWTNGARRSQASTSITRPSRSHRPPSRCWLRRSDIVGHSPSRDDLEQPNDCHWSRSEGAATRPFPPFGSEILAPGSGHLDHDLVSDEVVIPAASLAQTWEAESQGDVPQMPPSSINVLSPPCLQCGFLRENRARAMTMPPLIQRISTRAWPREMLRHPKPQA